MAKTSNNRGQQLELINQSQGHTVIPLGSPLMRLHYFDGKFLRAADLKAEQDFLRKLVALSNQAGGAGLVRGFDCNFASGDMIEIGDGLAVDPVGRVLLLPQKIAVGIEELIEKSRRQDLPPLAISPGSAGFEECEVRAVSQPGTVVQGSGLYLITIGQAEAFCGEEDVYGKLCESVCVTSTERPYIVEGLVIRAQPLVLRTPLATSAAVALTRAHLRSLVASACFADERLRCGDLISRAGLAADAWCLGARSISDYQDVPIGLLARSGKESVFLDTWGVRRERMVSPSQQYWACRMAMRPWNVFMAQVLQFQCQLRHCFGELADGINDDPCRDARRAVSDTARLLADFIPHYVAVSERIARAIQRDPELANGLPAFADAVNLLEDLKTRSQSVAAAPAGNRLLIQCGIVELPSAGYLPVLASRTVSVNQQVRNLMGEGVDLRFCVVRSDFVPHALEEAQHMERISLIDGLDHPTRKPRVDVLVPNGEIRPAELIPTGVGYEMKLGLFSPLFRLLFQIINPRIDEFGEPISAGELIQDLIRPGFDITFQGAARGETNAAGGSVFHFAGSFLDQPRQGPPAFTLIDLRKHSAVWSSMETDRDPFDLNRHESTRVSAELALLFAGSVFRLQLGGNLQVIDSQRRTDSEPRVRAQFSGSLTTFALGAGAQNATPRVVSINDEVVLVRRTNGAAHPTVEVLLPRPSLLGAARSLFLFQTVRRWNSPTSAEVDGVLQPYKPPQPAAPSFTLIELPGPIRFFHADQTINPEVLTSGHPANESAVTSVRAIAAALGEPQFDEIAVRKLFPPPRPIPSDLIVLARENWVLFHRRRDKQCAHDQPPSVAVQSRQYRLYIIDLGDVARRAELDQALKTNDGVVINGFAPQPVGVVEFAGGVHTLETSPDRVRADWQTRVAGAAEIAYGAVSSRGAAVDEGEALARARLATLSNVLDSVTPVLEGAPLETLDAVPDASIVSAEPYDGVMIVATVRVAMVCHEVYRLALNAQEVPDLLRAIRGTGAAEIAQLLARRQAQRLGKAVFHKGTDAMVTTESDDLSSAWQTNGNGQVGQVIVISQRPADPRNPTAEELAQIELHRNQAARISGQVGTAVQLDGVVHLPPEDAGAIQPCPAITLLVTNPQPQPVQRLRNELFLFPTIVFNFNEIRSSIRTSGIPKDVIIPTNSLAIVEFEQPTNQPTDESLKQVERRWKERFPQGIPRLTEIQFFSVSRQAATDEEEKLNATQAEVIQRTLLPQATVERLKNGVSDFPTNDPTLTLAVRLRIIE